MIRLRLARMLRPIAGRLGSRRLLRVAERMDPRTGLVRVHITADVSGFKAALERQRFGGLS